MGNIIAQPPQICRAAQGHVKQMSGHGLCPVGGPDGGISLRLMRHAAEGRQRAHTQHGGHREKDRLPTTNKKPGVNITICQAQQPTISPRIKQVEQVAQKQTGPSGQQGEHRKATGFV